MYRILSPTAILGYGFPLSSFEKAMELDLDLIGVDAGSMDAGPYYLGSGKSYMGTSQLERDLRLMIRGAIYQQCPLIVGSAGFSGGGPPFYEVVRIVKKLIAAEDPNGIKLAMISSEIESDQLLPPKRDLLPLGNMPAPDEATILNSTLVGQMGVEPIISALEGGAQIIICGRCYDPAVFAADPIRKGYPAGPAYHAAKILECGAIACEPGSGSDCLVAELYRDGRTVFYPSNPRRKATVHSIAAHTLYEKSRPDLFALPGGKLSIQRTEFFQIDDRKAGCSGSELQPMPYSLKIEGSQCLGHRVVSIVPLKNMEDLDEEIRIYGRNGVESVFAEAPIEEIGILTVVKSRQQNVVSDALSFLRSTMLHFGYEGRISTAGNLAFPFSPSDWDVPEDDGLYSGLFLAGTRDPVFQQNWDSIKTGVLAALADQHPALSAECDIEFIIADRQHPLAILETVHEDAGEAQKLSDRAFEALVPFMDKQRRFFKRITSGKAYGWSVYHLTHDMDWIRKLFPVIIERYSSRTWRFVDKVEPHYTSNRAEEGHEAYFDEQKNNISEFPGDAFQVLGGTLPLYSLAKVIRSKNAGINELTIDLIFQTKRAYEAAIRSGLFSRKNLSLLFNIDPEAVLGSYRYDPVFAIKFTLARPSLSGSPGERDVFGAQQHTRLLQLNIPVDG